MFFGKKISQPESSVLNTLAYLKRNVCNALRSKYGPCSYDGIDAIKHMRYSRIFPLLSRCDFMFFLCFSVGYMCILSVYMFYAALLA